MSTAEIATFAPSGTCVPLTSRMSVRTSWVDPGAAAVPVMVAGVAVTVAECAIAFTSSGKGSVVMSVNVPPSVKTAVAVYVPPGTMNPLFAPNSDNCVPPVIGNATVPFALLSSGDAASTATPSALPTPTRVLRVPAGPTISTYESIRVTPDPMDRVNVNTASSDPSGVSAPDAAPTLSTSTPSKCRAEFVGAGGNAGASLTTTAVAALWLPTESRATIDSTSSACAV